MTSRSAVALSTAESQLLAMVLVLTRRPPDWATGEPVAPTRSALTRHAPLFFGEALTDWAPAWDSLVERGLLRHDGHYELTSSGLSAARRLRRRFTRDGFGERLVRSEGSATYGGFCEEVFGIDLRQFSLLDRAQLLALLEVLELAAGCRALDLGCGHGRVTEHVADQTGAHCTGVDIATAAILSARRRTHEKRHRLRFQVADFSDPLRFPLRFDRIFAIDTVYLADDPALLVHQLLGCLAPGGRLAILASEVLRDGDETKMAPDRTRIHRALSAHSLRIHVRDFTGNEEAIWRQQRATAEALQSAFEREGNGMLARELVREAERSLAWVEARRVRRYLYAAELPSG